MNRETKKLACMVAPPRMWTTMMLLSCIVMTGSIDAAAPPPVPPDLTVSTTVDRTLTYNLGATGLRGWIFTKPASYLDSFQGRTTAASRQILVTHVGTKSPADGVMKVDDVILGVGGTLFADDARKSMAVAIQNAEKEENGGVLKVTRWRAGKTEQVNLKLNVIGTYSDTAPFNCAKSKRIFDDACTVLEQETLNDNWGGAVSALALMATGKTNCLPRVRAYARRIAKLELKRDMETWTWGYRAVFLAEYYLLTGDKEVLPAIKKYTVSLAQGQSLYGTFGHGMSPRTPDGQLHGSVPPYGPVNACGLVANIGIVLGGKCGVQDPEIKSAIERASGFFGYYVDKGMIPYGEHDPFPSHDENGKNAMAAVLFSLQGNRIRETRYYAKMVTASYENHEHGHTGQGFSYLWGPLGAQCGGDAAVMAFFKHVSWRLDLARRCDGSFTYDGQSEFGPGTTDDNTYFGKSGYDSLSPAACYVLTYSLPLKKLYLTGKEPTQACCLGTNDIAEAVASGRFDVDRTTKSAEELVAALGDWSPVVRGWAAEELGQRPGSTGLVARLITLAEGSDGRARQGAAETLGYLNSADALPVLTRLLTHQDRWLRYKAAKALRKMGNTAKPFVPAMLKAVTDTAEPLQPIVWDDPIQFAQCGLAEVLFQGLLRTTNALQEIPPKTLYPVIRIVLKNADGRGRACLENTIANLLTLEDVQALAPDILAAIAVPAPADTMFANDIRVAGLQVLAKYHFKEGIRVGVHYAKTQDGWASQDRMWTILAALKTYGTAAQETLPELRELLVFCKNQKDFPEGCKIKKAAAVEDAVKAIEAATTQPELRSIAK